jgi:type II secretory pathway component PulF
MNASQEQMRWARVWRKLLRLTRGRVTVLRAFEVLIEEEPDSVTRGILRSMREALDSGQTLSEAVEGHSAVFSRSVTELIRTAEKCGAWDDILREIAEGLEEGTFD